MKIIKFFLIIFSLTFFNSYSIEAIPITRTIWSVTTTNGGIFGYRDTDWELALGGSSGKQRGWVGVCSEPGWTRCKPPRNLTVLDLNDEQAVDYLSEGAESRIRDGELNGNLSYHIQVEGENFSRIYRISWNATRVLQEPTEYVGNGQTITMEVTRDDVVL